MIPFSHTAVFGSVVVLFVLALSFAALVSIRRVRLVAGASGVDVFLRKLVAVDRSKLALVAGPLLNQGLPDPADELEQWQIWELVGGMEGLGSLSLNCDILIELVCYVQQWYPEALPVAEQLRLHAREIQWHVERLKGAEARGNLHAAFPDYAQRAVAIYCTMTQHVVALYEACQAPGLQDLRAAL